MPRVRRVAVGALALATLLLLGVGSESGAEGFRHLGDLALLGREDATRIESRFQGAIQARRQRLPLGHLLREFGLEDGLEDRGAVLGGEARLSVEPARLLA